MEKKDITTGRQAPKAVLCAALTAALAAGCVPAVALAQAATAGQASATSQAATLHDRVLAGETVRPATRVNQDSLHTPAPDNWVQTAYERDGKVVVEIEGSDSDFYLWTADELGEIDPDVVVVRDYDENTVWRIEADWKVVESYGKAHSLLAVDGSFKSVKVDCIEPGELNSHTDAWIYVYGNQGRRVIDTFDMAWYEEDSNEFVDGADATLVIGKNVASLEDYWAAHVARNYRKVIFEEGSRLSHVGNACGYGESYIKEIEGLPSTAKLDDHALGLPFIEKVTDENGKDIKAPESVWTWQEGKYHKEYGALSPAAPSYWKQQLKKAKSISLSAKAKKSGKSAFAKVYNVTYKKSKVTVLKGSKYKKAAKDQAKKIAVSKAGKVTVKKGLKKGTYKVSVKATCKGHSKTVTATVKVK